MNLSGPFIRRPVATTLLTVAIVLAGMVAFFLLPVNPLPAVDFPVISVQAAYPGASPEDMAQTVSTPLERAMGRVAGINEITSQSSLGNARINVQFDLGRDINGAARDIQSAIDAARSLIPSLPSKPTYRKVNPAESPILILNLASESIPPGQLYDYASTILAQKLAQVEGVGQVGLGGSSLPAVRIDANPQALAKLGISMEQVRAAIAAANVDRPKGFIENGNTRWQVQANDQLQRARDYRPLIVAFRNNAPVRLSDIATVSDGVQDIHNAGMINGKPGIVIFVNRTPSANIIATVDRVLALLPVLRAEIPAAARLEVAIDRTPTIRASLREVERTLLLSTVLVIVVVFLFFRSARSAAIPLVVVPTSLIGTFAAMYLLGYSLDNLSLMALTVATGFVVDDAIVVMENIQRHLEQGMRPLDAALRGAREVGFTVFSISLSLIAVFVPILAMGGLVGRLFHEFAVVLSVAILISLVVSLTTTPMICARILKLGARVKAREAENAAALLEQARGLYGVLLRRYAASLRWSLAHGPVVLLILLVTISINVYLFIAIPKGFFPQQDTGRLMGSIQADQSISFQAMSRKLADYIAIIGKDPAVDAVIGFTGGGQTNTGTVFVGLKDLKHRHGPADEVINRLRRPLAAVPGSSIFLQSVQDLRVGGRSGNAQYQYTLQGEDLDQLRAWSPRILAELQKDPRLADVNTDQQDKGISEYLTINRDEAGRLGVNPAALDATLSDLYSQRNVSVIYNPLNQYQVVLEAALPQLESPSSLERTYLVGSSGQAIPLSAITTRKTVFTALAVNHQGQFAATTITFNLAPGVSLGQATDAIQEHLRSIGVPSTIIGGFQGTAKVFQESLGSQPFLILCALLTIYIVLGILYESLIHPVTILSTLPSAGVGALLALMAFHVDFSLIALIGVILLIGIVKKNAIMMIDFALTWQREHHSSAREAILEACVMRFRPIMMTTVAAMLGAVPLAVGFGDGAELRQPLGISIVGGLAVSQLLTLFTTPVVFLYLDRVPRTRKEWRAMLRRLDPRSRFAQGVP